MGLYLSGGDIGFGWKSFGRWFALAGFAALIVAATGFGLTYGLVGRPTEIFSQFMALAAFYVGGGLFILLMAGAAGSLLSSLGERGDVEVANAGVRRIFRPGREEFFPRDEIAGFVSRPWGGVALVDAGGRRKMIIPRSLDGYRDCIAELKAMGFRSLPASRLRANPRASRGERIFRFLEVVVFVLYIRSIGGHTAGAAHRIAGVTAAVALHRIFGATAAVVILFDAWLFCANWKRRWTVWLHVAVLVTVILVLW